MNIFLKYSIWFKLFCTDFKLVKQNILKQHPMIIFLTVCFNISHWTRCSFVVALSDFKTPQKIKNQSHEDKNKLLKDSQYDPSTTLIYWYMFHVEAISHKKKKQCNINMVEERTTNRTFLQRSNSNYRVFSHKIKCRYLI